MRSRDRVRQAIAFIVVVLVVFAIAAFLLDLDNAIGGKFSVWERVGVLGLALLLLAPLVVYRAGSRADGLLATLLGTAFWFPWIAAVASSALYLANIDGNSFWHDNSLLIGSAIAGVLWLLHALADTDYATAKRQSPGWYGLLQGEIGALRREVDGRTEPRVGATGEAVRRQVRGQLDQVEHDLGRTGLQWVTRSGFNAAWTHYHLADATWIEASPTPSVVALAMADILRLDGSDISLRSGLQADLWRAVTELDPKLGPYVETLVSADVMRIKSGTTIPTAATTTTATTPSASAAKPKAGFLERIGAMGQPETAAKDAKLAGAREATPAIEQERRARAVIQSVHKSLNDYRGARWAELARARWQLVLTTTIAGTFSLLVLGLALIQAVPTANLVAGWAYFLVGAIAGLFLRLRQAAEEEHVADDYGLESARLNQTPLLSGMAAVIGVVLMASLAGSTLGDVLRPVDTAPSPGPTAYATVEASAEAASAASPSPSASVAPSPSATPSAAETSSTTADLATAFDLGTYPIGLIIALTFGLTPNLVLQRLGVTATRAKKDLVATRTT